MQHVASGLDKLVEFTGDINSSMYLYFTATDEFFGMIQEVELCEKGNEIPVTQDNKHDFITLYINYLLKGSVAEQLSSLIR